MKYGTISYLCTDGKVLMIKKGERKDDPNSGFFTLPGGKLNHLEKGLLNPKGRLTSARRETEEETGLLLNDLYPRGVILFDNSERVFDNWPNPKDFLVYIFDATIYEGTLKQRTEEGTPIWVPESEILSIPKNEGDNKIYEWLRNPLYFIGVIKLKEKILNKEETFVDYIR